MTIDTARLRALAEAATPGKRSVAGSRILVDDVIGAQTWGTNWRNDQAYIAAADPTTMLALLGRLAELEGREPEWEYSIAYPRGDGWETDGVDPFKTYADAEYELARDEYLDQDRVVRRRKAGEWEPVTGDDDALDA